jgi:hemerythrin
MENIINWNKKYETGIEDIDFQHHYFFNLLKKILNYIQVHEYNQQMLWRLFDELQKYAVFHFTSEENIMIMNNYPDIEKHRTLHIKIIEDMNYNVNLFDGSTEKIEELIKKSNEWIIKHTLEEDKKIGKFLLGL